MATLSPTTSAPPDWARTVTNRLARQLPEPSVPSRFFLVKDFVLNQRSGKIDRTRLPKLSDLPTDADAKLDGRRESTQTVAEEGFFAKPRTDADDDSALVICRELFGPSIGWDDCFADHGGHSILIAQLAQRLAHEPGLKADVLVAHVAVSTVLSYVVMTFFLGRIIELIS